MRRAQIDSTSQIVRNLAKNPTFQALSSTAVAQRNNFIVNPVFQTAFGTTNVRTNLFTNPNLESVGTTNATVRTNLAPNPSMEAGSGSTAVRVNLNTSARGVTALPGYGTQTITGNVAITGHPEGFTTANRVTYSGGNANPGVILLPTTSSGQTYFMSAWVYHETVPSSGSQAFAEAGVISGPSPVMEQGIWKKYTWTRTSTGSSFGFRVGSPTTSGSFLITGMQVEISPNPVPYFDALTTTTNRVTGPNMDSAGGLANLRTNYCPNPKPTSTTGFVAINPTLTTMSNGVSAVRGDCNGTNIPYIFSPRCTISVAVGETYTLSATVEFSAGIKAVHIRANRRSTNEYFTSGQTLNYDPTGKGVHRISCTFTSPSAISADDLCLSLNYFNSVGGAPAATEWAKMGEILIEKAGTTFPYFDGASGTSGDFSHGWTGTANASASVEQAQTVGWWSNRWYGANGGAGYAYRSSNTGMSGGYSFRKVWTQSNTGSTQDVGVAQVIPVVEGVTYTSSIYAKCSIDTNITSFIEWLDTSGAQISRTPLTSVVTSPSGTWVRGSITATSPTGAVSGRFVWGPYASSNPFPAGTVLDFDWAMVEESSVLRTYQDGTPAAPGDYTYAWSGAANNSTSQMKMTGVTGYNAGSSVVGQSVEWANIGSKSLRITPNLSTADSFAVVPYTLQTGKTYTISATLRLEAPQTGTMDTVRGRRIYVYHSNVTGGGTVNGSTQSPNAAGVYQHSVTFTVTDGSQYQNIRLYNGAALGGGDVWWDNVLIEEADHVMPYFDGSTSAAQDFTHAWSGTAHASTSLQRVNLPSGVSLSGNRWGLQSTEWSARGTKSLKIPHLYAAGGSNTDNFVEVHNMISGSLKTSTTYTIAATCRTSQVLGGTVDGLAFKFRVNLGSDIPITYTSTKTNTPGVVRVIGSFTTSATITMNFIRLMAGASYGNGDVWWDELTLEEGLTDGSYFDGSSWSQQNLIANPSFETDVIGWAGAGMSPATLSRVTSQSQSGSACMQISCSGSVVLQGAFTASNRPVVMPEMTYTASAWVKADAGKRIAIECGELNSSTALNGARTQSAYTTASGNWQRISVTRTMGPSAAYADIVIRNVDAVAHTFYADSVMLTQTTSVTPDYYAGTGDFTPVWSGSANLTSSYLRAPALIGWSNASNGFPYQSSVSPYSGSTVAGVSTRGTNGDGIYHQDVSITEGKTYTLSAWIKLTSSVPSFSGVLRFKDANQTILGDLGSSVITYLTVGSWTQVSVSGTAPVGATKLQPMWRIYASHTPTTFYIDNVLLEDGPTLRPYFDGSTPASGDFTYAWTGQAHNSYSTQRAAVVNAQLTSKSGSNPDSKFHGYQTTFEDGAKGMRWVAPAGTPNSGWRVAGIAGGTGWDYTKIKAGGQYTLMFKHRSFGWGTNTTLTVQISTGGAQNQVMGGLNVTLNQTGWQEYRRTFTALRDADSSQQIYLSLPTTPSPTTDGIFDIRDWMLVEGAYTGDFIDGNKPFSKWEGAANDSTSIGYPPQLFNLAGKPKEDWSAAGTFTLDDSFGQQEGRTFYTVYETTGILNSIVANILAYGESSLNDTIPNSFLTLRQNSYDNSTVNSLAVRKTNAMGITIAGQKLTRHVASWGIDSAGQIFGTVDGALEIVDPGAGGAMYVPHQKIAIYANSGYHIHVRTIMFRGKHDRATQLSVIKYLGNKYGINIP